jgi:chromosome transmission fidelity protein 18
MEITSSPLVYPATSSPRAADSPQKRRKLSNGRNPLKEVNANARRGGFVEDESDDEDTPDSRLFHKKAHSPDTAREPPQGSVEPVSQTVIRVESLFDKAGLPENEQSDSAYASDAVEHDSLSEAILEAPRHISSSQPGNSLLRIRTSAGRETYVGERKKKAAQTYEQIIAARSVHVDGHAKRSYYGVDIHRLLDDLAQDEKLKATTLSATVDVRPTIEKAQERGHNGKQQRTLMWTEKYRARKFTDLVGDERTHRSVLRWLKGWDQIVFPGSKQKQLLSKKHSEQDEQRTHRKVLLLTGPPGLGKTTLAHVCARQAGYEIQEINASDERSKDVVKGRIRDMVGTENVRGHNVATAGGTTRKAGKPVCVVVDEVDGVVGGSGGSGEGGFIKALIDLLALDERNSRASAIQAPSGGPNRKRKGDKFRMLRPLILICNDVYHPSLRPLRQGSVAEIIHMRKPNLNMVISRVHNIFEKEGVPSDVDGVRRLCEATWGVSTKKEGGTGTGTGEGDIRSVMVVGEWVATKLRASSGPLNSICPRLTRKWIEGNILGDLGHGGGAARSLGRGGAREVADRVFQEGAGFPKTNPVTAVNAAQAALDKEGVVGVAEASKRRAVDRLREMIDMSGETERIVTDCFTSYPTQPIQDDTFLSKPNAAYDWLHFHDVLSSQITNSQEWELAPYMSTSVLAFHHLFASSHTARHTYSGRPKGKDEDEEAEKVPFSGPSASFTAFETLKANTASITTLQSSLSLPLARMYRSHVDIAIELLPYTLRMLAPDVKPVVINSNAGPTGARSAPTASVRKASEKALVVRAVECMAATGVRFEKSRIENEAAFNKSASGGWVYRMEPPLDSLASYETMKGGSGEKGVRYAVRQVLELEWRKQELKKGEETRVKKMAGEDLVDGMKDKYAGGLRKTGPKRDFFGRVVRETAPVDLSSSNGRGVAENKSKAEAKKEHGQVWLTYHEGFSNAVRKPMTLKELMDGM